MKEEIKTVVDSTSAIITCLKKYKIKISDTDWIFLMFHLKNIEDLHRKLYKDFFEMNRNASDMKEKINGK